MTSNESGPRPTPRRTPGRDEARITPRPTAESIAADVAASASMPVLESEETGPGTSRWSEYTQGHVPGSHPHNRARSADARIKASNSADVARNVFVGVLALGLAFGAGFLTRLSTEGGSSTSNDPTAVTEEQEIDGWKTLCSGTKIVEVVDGSTYSSLTAQITAITPQEGQPVLPAAVAEEMNADRNGDEVNEIYAGEAKEIYTNCTTNFDQPPTTTTG